MSKVDYQISGAAFPTQPIDMVYGLVYTDGEVLEIPKRCPFRLGWGKPESYCINDSSPSSYPRGLEICYLSISEEKFYEARIEFPDNLFDLLWEPEMEYITFGMAPGGKLAIWICGEKKTVLVCEIEAEETEVDMELISPYNPEITLKAYCQQFNLPAENPLEPERNVFDSAMCQYNYRYVFVAIKPDKTNVEKEQKGEMEFDWIEDSLTDGTCDKLHDGRLNKYHSGGVPEKFNLSFHSGRMEWEACVWFEDDILSRFFKRFYGAHHETKADFIIRIDAENRKYELALYRQGLKEPVVIPESAYQMIVFKNKFEDYRSENYNQPRGAWIW